MPPPATFSRITQKWSGPKGRPGLLQLLVLLSFACFWRILRNFYDQVRNYAGFVRRDWQKRRNPIENVKNGNYHISAQTYPIDLKLGQKLDINEKNDSRQKIRHPTR